MTFVPSQAWLSDAPAAAPRVRRMLAWMLLRASAVLSGWARRVHAPTRSARLPVASAAPYLEFHAEAGAPEGALYVDGVLFGRLDGVSRL
jgi:hypothetical protein